MAYDEISFFVPMKIPTVTHNDLVVRKRNGISFIGKSEKLKIAEAKWESYLAIHKPKMPLDGALSVNMVFCYLTKTKSKHGHPKDTKPDLDNLAKTVCDAMGRLGWFSSGDQQIADLRITKIWDKVEGLRVEIKPILTTK